MNSRKLFLRLAAASGYIGVGMLLAYSFTDRLHHTPFWVGMLLVLCAALLLGMYISARSEPSAKNDRPVSSSGNITDLPPKQQP